MGTWGENRHAYLAREAYPPPPHTPTHPPACPHCSVLFNFLGRDFFNALSAKDQEQFTQMLFKWLGAICLGIPVYVLR